MNWKQSLDRYLTTPPDDGFERWHDTIMEDEIELEFFNQHEDWLLDYKGQCNTWLNNLFNKGKEPKETAQIIQRAYNMFILNK